MSGCVFRTFTQRSMSISMRPDILLRWLFPRRFFKKESRRLSCYVNNFLCGGCSKDPIDLLAAAGVDMSTPQPVEDALTVFETYLEQFTERDEHKIEVEIKGETNGQNQKFYHQSVMFLCRDFILQGKTGMSSPMTCAHANRMQEIIWTIQRCIPWSICLPPISETQR